MRYLIILLIAFALFGCSKSSSCTVNPNDLYAADNSKVAVDTIAPGRFQVYPASGEKVVFNYTRWFDCAQVTIYDRGHFEKLIFEVSPTANSFSYKNNDLALAKCYYYESCNTCADGWYIPNAGIIEGEKNGKNWNVTVDLELKSGKQLQFSETFNGH